MGADTPQDSEAMAATMYDAANRAGHASPEDAALRAGAAPSGADTVTPLVRVQDGPIDLGAEAGALVGAGAVGGLVTFTGYCRDEGGTLAALELEHYPGMAEREITRICREAAQRWPLLGVTAIHRYGLIRPGEIIVLVACASAHRSAAFEAAEFVMDFMKTKAPFWKREHRRDGTAGGWVEAKDTDTAASDRWHRL